MIARVVYSEISITVQKNSDGTTTPQLVETVVEALKTVDNTSVFTIMIVMTFALLGLVVTKRR